MTGTDIIGRHKTEVETPALLLYIEAVEQNIRRMANFFSDKECNLRPHCKTHKLPLIAHEQMKAGAIGISCATLPEAEIMLQSGISSVLIANEIVGETKIRKMVNLAAQGELIVCVDNIRNAEQISQAAKAVGRTLNVLVEVNVGLNRCGVPPGKPALRLAQQVWGLENIAFRGLMGYEGGIFIHDAQEKKEKCTAANRALVDTAKLIETNDIPVEIVSAGGSNTFSLTGTYPGITEVQVGSYATMDSHNREYGLNFEQAISLMATVISRPEKERTIIDAGKKAISSDEGLPSFTTEGIMLFKLNEEHGYVRIEGLNSELSVGDKLELIPSHGCTTTPLYSRYLIVRNDRVEDVVEVKARR